MRNSDGKSKKEQDSRNSDDKSKKELDTQNSDNKSKKAQDSRNSDDKSKKEQDSQSLDDKSKKERDSRNSDDKSHKEQDSPNSGQYLHNNQPLTTQPNSNQYNFPVSHTSLSNQRHNYDGSPPNQGWYGYHTAPYQHVVYVQQVPSGRGVYRSGRENVEEQRQPPDSPSGYSGFSDVQIRKVFVRKVYLILMLQLLFTLGIIALFAFEPHVKEFVQKNPLVLWISFGIFFATSYMFGAISSKYDNDAIFMAVGICAAVCFAVTLFSFNTKFDFTSCGGILCILLLILIIFGFIAMFVQSKVMTLIYAGLGAIVFTMYLAYDTQMLMGGKNIEIDPEEHILAAIQIYLDVLYIFMYILMIIGIVQE